MIEPVTFDLVLPSDKYLSLLKDCRETHNVPIGGIVYAGITHTLYSNRSSELIPLEAYLVADSVPVHHKVVLSQFVISKMRERFGDRYETAISASTINIILNDTLITEWYRYQIEGGGSGKISKTK